MNRLTLFRVLMLTACRTAPAHEESPADAASEPALGGLRERAMTERASWNDERAELAESRASCPPMNLVTVTATLARNVRAIRGAAFECVGQTPAGPVWAAHRPISEGDCDQKTGLLLHWLVLLTPDPRIVHTAMSEDGGCPCPTMPYDFASVFTRTGQMFRSRTDPDGGVSYERLGADGFVFDPQASAELQQDDARKDALDVLASLTPEVPAHDAKVVAARGALGW